MRATVSVFLLGLLFGAGLVISGMTQPEKVVSFLNVAGSWDPSLAFVMGGAMGVNLIATRLMPRLAAPIFGGAFALPTRTDINPRLVGGAALFGVGWGLGGFCPGPALTSVVGGASEALIFVGAMLGGMALFHLADTTLSAPPKPAVEPGKA
jgi:uncharacterized protein